MERASSWSLIYDFSSQVFLNFHSLIRYSEPRILSMLLFLRSFDVEG